MGYYYKAVWIVVAVISVLMFLNGLIVLFVLGGAYPPSATIFFLFRVTYGGAVYIVGQAALAVLFFAALYFIFRGKRK
ncbi:MAG: hypothetical protein ABH864_02585 [archaeon]